MESHLVPWFQPCLLRLFQLDDSKYLYISNGFGIISIHWTNWLLGHPGLDDVLHDFREVDLMSLCFLEKPATPSTVFAAHPSGTSGKARRTWNRSGKITSGGWLNHPSEKYARQIGNLPQIGVKRNKCLKPPPKKGTFVKMICFSLTDMSVWIFFHHNISDQIFVAGGSVHETGHTNKNL